MMNGQEDEHDQQPQRTTNKPQQQNQLTHSFSLQPNK